VSDWWLTTPRLGFGRWRGTDLNLALALWGDPEVARLIGGPWSEAEVAARLNAEIAMATSHGVQYWPVFLRATGDLVGAAGLRPREPGGYELGFHLRPAHWGRGYGREAAEATIGHAFETLGARFLFAGHHPDNAPSKRLLERLGFRPTHDELYPPTGLRHPCYRLDAPDATERPPP